MTAPRNDHSVAVSHLPQIVPPSEADIARYAKRTREIGFTAASFEYAREQARKLMGGDVVDLDEWKARR